jgi:hypothetical protein
MSGVDVELRRAYRSGLEFGKQTQGYRVDAARTLLVNAQIMATMTPGQSEDANVTFKEAREQYIQRVVDMNRWSLTGAAMELNPKIDIDNPIDLEDPRLKRLSKGIAKNVIIGETGARLRENDAEFKDTAKRFISAGNIAQRWYGRAALLFGGIKQPSHHIPEHFQKPDQSGYELQQGLGTSLVNNSGSDYETSLPLVLTNQIKVEYLVTHISMSELSDLSFVARNMESLAHE